MAPALAAARPHHDPPLPPGWEICVLHGVGAPVTAANVADLDAWQQAEGGATANPEAYNPFNTRRGTDQSEQSLPATWTSGGFPSFRTWPQGCAATSATIAQSNMAAISQALESGDVSPPAAFLATVDQTPWCAASDATPCYTDEITGGAVPSASSALSLLHDATTTLAGYVQETAALAAAEQKLSASHARLAIADVEVGFARYGVERATADLRKFAISDYTSNPSIDKMASAVQAQGPSQSDLLTQYYTSLGSGIEVARLKAAQATLSRVETARAPLSSAETQDDTAVTTAGAAVDGALGRLAITLVTLHTAGACTPGSPAPAATGSATPTGAPTSTQPTASTTSSTTTSTTSSTTTTTTSSTTTTTMAPHPPPQLPPASPNDPPVVTALRACLASLGS